jgi:thioredoxin 1
MGIATAVIADAKAYQQVLKAHKTVFMLFVSQHCPACGTAGPLFERVARQYGRTVKSLVLDTAQTPRHPEVTGTPTLLVFQNGKMINKLKGFDEKTLRETFAKTRISPPTSNAPSPTPESRHPAHR